MKGIHRTAKEFIILTLPGGLYRVPVVLFNSPKLPQMKNRNVVFCVVLDPSNKGRLLSTEYCQITPWGMWRWFGHLSNSGFDPSSFLKTGNTSEFSSSCTTRIVFILTTGVSFLRSYKVSNKRPIMGCPGSDLDCPKTVSGWTGYVSVQSEYG